MEEDKSIIQLIELGRTTLGKGPLMRRYGAGRRPESLSQAQWARRSPLTSSGRSLPPGWARFKLGFLSKRTGGARACDTATAYCIEIWGAKPICYLIRGTMQSTQCVHTSNGELECCWIAVVANKKSGISLVLCAVRS